MTLIQELKWRGLVQDIMPGTEDYLENNKIGAYVGFDPTADSLHIGNLVPMTLLKHLQNYGHKPFALVGGATGMIGDPSGKSAERNFLDETTLRHNQACVHAQLRSYLDFDTEINPAEMVNNYDWFKEMGFLEFLRKVGKYITINYMKSKDSVKNRIESDQGISYTEFTYQLVQGYDFYWLYKNKGVTLQMGGADQWGNITTGTELTRKIEGENSDAKLYAFTAPLVTREDGTKFGKTADGKNIWLDAKRTSPFQFYQYWLNVSDADAEKYIKIFTFLPITEIQAIIDEGELDKSKRLVHKALASEVTRLIHGEKGLQSAINMTAFMFNPQIGAEMLVGFSEEEWESVIENAAENDLRKLSTETLSAGMTLTDLLIEIKVATSRGNARQIIETDKAVSVNGVKITDNTHQLSLSDAFYGKYLFIQKGKKNKLIVQIRNK